MKTFEQIVDEVFKPEPFKSRYAHHFLSFIQVTWSEREQLAFNYKYENAIKIMKPYRGADISSPTEEICREILSPNSRFTFVEEEMSQAMTKVVIEDATTTLSIEVRKIYSAGGDCMYHPSGLYNINREGASIIDVFTPDEEKLIEGCVREFVNCKEEAYRLKQEEETRLKNEKIRRELTSLYSKG